MPIHSAQPEASSSASPASRMPQAPERASRRRSSSQGPANSDTDEPMANAAITAAP